jgi:ring-1,2-phenylacetyl-CoA epoxidase subunit PaaB
MSDQWPKYEVFKQERDGAPFRNVGSVHAPDAEMALLAARDVFARRPACHSLWVVPAAAIVARSIQEPLPDAPPGPVQPYAICAKQSQRQAMTYVDLLGHIETSSAAEALRLAPAAFAVVEATVWWAFPASAITASDPADVPGLAAATGKRFRLPNEYHTVFTMQQIRRGDEGQS